MGWGDYALSLGPGTWQVDLEHGGGSKLEEGIWATPMGTEALGVDVSTKGESVAGETGTSGQDFQ